MLNEALWRLGFDPYKKQRETAERLRKDIIERDARVGAESEIVPVEILEDLLITAPEIAERHSLAWANGFSLRHTGRLSTMNSYDFRPGPSGLIVCDRTVNDQYWGTESIKELIIPDNGQPATRIVHAGFNPSNNNEVTESWPLPVKIAEYRTALALLKDPASLISSRSSERTRMGALRSMSLSRG